MSERIQAIVIHEHGAPGEVARLETMELASPGPGEALVRVCAAPINPADLNVVEGKYPVRPALPGVPGVEGSARVAAVGPAVEGVQPGDLVILPHGFGSWREAGIVRAADLVVVPRGIDPVQAAMLKINPPTALRMLRDFVPLAAGDVVLQNSANSGVGRAVIQIARQWGVRTINLVRRLELVEELRAEGADFVFLDDEHAAARIAEAAAGAPVRLALNGVGGESALRMANALAESGTIVTYGAMGRQPLRIPNGLLIFKDLAWRGFWLSAWMRRSSAEERAALFGELFALSQRGVLRSHVERIYSIHAFQEALGHAQRGGRAGKILFGFGSELGE